MEDRRATATLTDALQSTTFRLYSSAAAPVTGAAALSNKYYVVLVDGRVHLKQRNVYVEDF
jgi:hypothetical protein